MPFLSDPSVWFKEVFFKAGLSYGLSSFLSTLVLIAIVLFLSWLANLIAKGVILTIVTRIVKKTTSTWDDIFLEQKVFTRLSHLAPALVIWFMAGWALKEYPIWLIRVHNLSYIYMVIAGTVVLSSFIEAWHKIYNTLEISQHRHIKGYVQLVKIFVYLVAVLVIVSVVFKKDILTLLAGLGAMAAVLILVFKDTLLGLVGSIQLSANDMLKIGDWITIPGRSVDGLVTDITLYTVKIQNFDKTIITVPTYSLVNESFQNWKGMEAAGVRQIKRSIYIDMTSIRFPDKALLEKLSRVPVLKAYFASSNKHNSEAKTDGDSDQLGSMKVTNLGLFRIYAENYLQNHPDIDKSQTIVVRHRPADGNGLPLEIYAFSKLNQFNSYENVQSELFEHLIAVLNEFGLKVFQQPTGHDLTAVAGRKELLNNH
jgi:miniconductance mechanosensitive channel